MIVNVFTLQSTADIGFRYMNLNKPVVYQLGVDYWYDNQAGNIWEIKIES